MKTTPGPAPCPTCPQRTWRSIGGFMVMGCAPKGLKFGTAPDLLRGHVNKAGGCVGMPRECCGALELAVRKGNGKECR